MSSSVFHRDLRAAYPSVVSAEGMYLRTESGQRILDAVGGAATVVLGHGVREITDAIARHGSELSFTYGATFTNPWQEQLAEALVAMNPEIAVRPPGPAQGHCALAELPRQHARHAVAVRPPGLEGAVPAAAPAGPAHRAALLLPLPAGAGVPGLRRGLRR